MLPDLQAAFRAGTIGRDAAAVAALANGGMENGHRFGIYRNNIFQSLTGVLEAAFPTIRKLVGDENFAVLAHRFIAAHPPQRPQLYAYGGDFASFLAGFGPAVEELPFLPDLAQVEWAVNEAYFEADAEPLSADHLAGLAPEPLRPAAPQPAPHRAPDRVGLAGLGSLGRRYLAGTVAGSCAKCACPAPGKYGRCRDVDTGRLRLRERSSRRRNARPSRSFGRRSRYGIRPRNLPGRPSGGRYVPFRFHHRCQLRPAGHPGLSAKQGAEPHER